ncbi:SDR family NAD(P)-dependent oxidoreductase [Chryseobacterium sp. BIGb0232]|uniref:SDR family NAD(P)-dependent oxidoreductase n=1 Tax=Chryseobacterium sp. BIGb0232 TaxID=2940598 RepID=UPI000FBF361F|nr:SDR family oxidoreductase [Chryseobacterium sp. BIGb0232]MCS4302443.1 NAD(P)-dependent dehydrogenase (short-subunit alcohol dehydrogenase family) [Chryseobacterium sp. BIGb0232]ROS18385.1 NAD(P)-dependent dehydrogenase (short-subunit alcohol dehydrogenase family) [Chryseobacterium nakagawai]
MEKKSGLVTGAASGIGRASAIALANAGANVMVSDLNEVDGWETVTMIKDLGGTADFFKCNVGIESDIEALVKATVERFGSLDFAHNNAGIPAVSATLLESSSEDWLRTLNINLSGVYYAMKHQIREMIRSGNRGSIVNTSSATSLDGYKNMCAYSSAKAGLNQLTKCIALEYGEKGIRVNAVAPGPVNTPLAQAFVDNNPEEALKYTSIIPTGKFSNAEDIANTVVWLCSDLSNQINGIIIPIDGGISAGKF